MNGQFELRSPVDFARLNVIVADLYALPLQEPLTDSEYLRLAALLEQHPQVMLSIGGFDTELTRLDFLHWFPNLRRISIGLHHLDSLSSLNALSSKLEYLYLGQPKKALDLRPLDFTQLRRLRIAGHNKGLRELLERNTQLTALALRGTKADLALSDVDLPLLESLTLTLGSLTDAACLAQLSSLRLLALRQVKRCSRPRRRTRPTQTRMAVARHPSRRHQDAGPQPERQVHAGRPQ